MAGVSYVIDDTQIQSALGRVAAAGRDTHPLMEAIAGYMLFSTQRRFETESGPDGQKWPPLSPRTAAKRIGRARRGTEHMLRVSARLYSSLVGEATASEAVTGTNVVYAAIHQLGGEINMPARKQSIRLRTVKGRTRFARKAHKRARDMDVSIGAHTITIPARPYLGFSDEDRQEIGRIIIDFNEAAAAGGIR